MKTILIIAALVALSSARRSQTKVSADLTTFFDKFVGNFRSYVVANDLDPLEIPDIFQSFEATPLLITYTGSLHFTNGTLRNLVNLKRIGKVTLTYVKKNLDLEVGLGVNYLVYHCNYVSEVMNIGASGRLVGTVSKIATSANVFMDLSSYNLTLGSFEVTKLGRLRIKLKGNIITDWFASIISNIAVNVFKGTIVSTIEKQVATEISQSFADINSYIQGSSERMHDR